VKPNPSAVDRSQRVTLRLVNGYEFVAEFPDVVDSPSILIDEPPPIGEGRGPNAAALLGAAVGNCLAASFTHCVRRSRLDLEGMTVHVNTHVDKNDSGRFRIAGIDVEIEPEMPDADWQRVQRCEQLFEDFCIVTASVRNGIPVNVTVNEKSPAGV
jgi:uncharacterized OsmC-like protein